MNPSNSDARLADTLFPASALDSSPIAVKAMELKQKNRELQDRLRQFENMETVSVTTAAAYKRLVAAQELGTFCLQSNFFVLRMDQEHR